LDDEEVAIKTLQMDVQDYLTKGQFDGNLLVRSIRYARERKRVIMELQASEARFRRLSESGVIGIAYFDINGRISDGNDTFLKMIGYSREELKKSFVRWDRLLPPEWRPNMIKIARSFTETGRIAPYETEYLGRDGSRHWGVFGAARIEGTAGGIAFIVDITGRKKLEEEIRHMANHDALTGLPNRRLFMELIRFGLEEAYRNRKKMGFLFLDLDRFKGVNDSLGHEAGDELLKTVAERLKSALRKADAVARIGGDEFSILLAGIAGPEDITEIVRKILVALREKCVIAGREFHITTSMGISIYPDDSDDIATLFRYADIALYRAKDQGRNTFAFYNPEITVR
jgi:diguanylate cyclase (GGDEF)-like protein/PAS domain S-box-containing protein